MQWSGVCLVAETRSFLERQAGEVRAAKEELLTFYLTDAAVPDPERHPFFTGRGTTAELAEQAAYTVYLRAQQCAHVFRTKDAAMSSCQVCGVQLRVVLQGATGNSAAPLGWWRRWNWFS